MDLTQEEFGEKFRDTVDGLILAMAEHEDVNLEKFYSMACVLENLSFFSPIIYGAITKTKEQN